MLVDFVWTRGKVPDVWPFEQILAKGYAVATFYNGDIQPDRPNVREGMRATLPERPGGLPGDETATIMFWAWGVHRAVDFLAIAHQAQSDVLL